MSQRTFLSTGTVNDPTNTPVANAPCSFQIIPPAGTSLVIDGNGALVETTPYAFTAAGDGSFSQAIDFPGDYQTAYQNSIIRLTLNGTVIDSPIGFGYAASIAASSWIGTPSTAGLVRMRALDTTGANTGVGGTLVSIYCSQLAIAPNGAKVSSSVPVQALTDSSGTAFFTLWPSSVLNPSNTQYIAVFSDEQETLTFVAPATTDNFLGPYNPATTYHPASGTSNGDVFTYLGVTYRTTLTSIGHTPPNGTYYTALPSSGAGSLPTDLITNYYNPPAQAGQVATQPANIVHSTSVPALADDPTQAPVSMDDDLRNLAKDARKNLVTKNTTYAFDAVADDWVLADTTPGAFTLSLPDATLRTREARIIRKDSTAHPLTIAAFGGQTINGAASQTLTSQYLWAILMPDTVNGVWYMLLATMGGGGSSTFSYVLKTANYTVLTTDSGIEVDATSGNVTITLPTAVGLTQLFAIKRVDGSAHTVTIATTSAQTIDGFSTLALSAQYQEYVVGSNNANWRIYGATYPNPMTTQDDLVIAGALGVPTRLAKGTSGQVLTVDPATGHLLWSAATGGFTSPLTTKGDLQGFSTVAARVPVGADTLVLTADSTQATGLNWKTPTSGELLVEDGVTPPATLTLENQTDFLYSG